MSVPSTSKLKKTTEEIYVAARQEGTLSSLTPRIIRQKIEEQLGLEKGVLDDKKYKTVVGEAIDEARKKPAKDSDEESNNTPEEKDEESEDSEMAAEKPRGKKRKSAETTSKGRSRASGKKQQQQQFKSAEFVPTSDVEPDEPDANSNVKVAPRKAASESEGEESDASKPPPKKRKKTAPISSSSVKSEASASKGASSPTAVEDAKLSSDLSDLEDEPKKKSKGKAKDKKTSQAASKKTKSDKKSTATLSKDEATIKRLKGFINACGVRKVWSKVFEGVEDHPSKQIKMLRDILTDLGMSGRPSMEQAKAIKEKRALASELEDVQNFEKAMLGQGSRRSRQATKEKKSEEEDKQSESEEEDERPAKRKSNARQSIMAFLQDQSDSD